MTICLINTSICLFTKYFFSEKKIHLIASIVHFRSDGVDSIFAPSITITKLLAKITKTHFNKTLTDLIAERIIIEAKRELYLTNKSVKEIAYSLGYHDEHYFSRFFKKNADVSPQLYRETVGFGRDKM